MHSADRKSDGTVFQSEMSPDNIRLQIMKKPGNNLWLLTGKFYG